MAKLLYNRTISYDVGEQNIITEEFQMIRLTEGCPHTCPWCYEWRVHGNHWKSYDLPEIVRNDVRITDMNLLAKSNCLDYINAFEDLRVNGKVVYPHLICGIDYRFLTDEIAEALKRNRFQKLHLAWDGLFTDKSQKDMNKAIRLLKKYKHRDVSVFMICNHPDIPYNHCIKKLELCKYWGVKANDCYFDNQLSPNIEPIGWTEEEIKHFRKFTRKHNQMVLFGIDPQFKESDLE